MRSVTFTNELQLTQIQEKSFTYLKIITVSIRDSQLCLSVSEMSVPRRILSSFSFFTFVHGIS